MKKNKKAMSSNQRTTKKPSRIAFGACNNQNRQNNLWRNIESRNPAAFIWGGDAIYADQDQPMDFTTFPPKGKQVKCATPDRVRALYEQQLYVPDYRRLLSQNITIFGTIDDHDYGCDNAGKSYPYKYETTNAFVEFLGEEEDSPMALRAAAGYGVYGVKLFDFDRPEGHILVPDEEARIDPDVEDNYYYYNELNPWMNNNNNNNNNTNSMLRTYSNKTVAVFVLDVRTNKDPWKEGTNAYQKDYDGDFLGERQWIWFEHAMKRSKASINIIVNGLQVNSDMFPNPNIAENWASFPRSRQRLFDLILHDNVSGPSILVSGDVHMTQFMREECRRNINNNPMTKRRPIIEMTTSGMTHSWGTIMNKPINNPNYQYPIIDHIESIGKRFLMNLMHWINPWTMLVRSDDDDDDDDDYSGDHHNGGYEGAKKGLQYSLEKNFGELEFDWDERMVIMRTIGEDPLKPPLLSSRISIDQLSGHVHMSGSTVTDDEFDTVIRQQQQQQQQHPSSVSSSDNNRDWVCIHYRGHVSIVQTMLGHVMTVLILILMFLPLPILLFRRLSISSRSMSNNNETSTKRRI